MQTYTTPGGVTVPPHDNVVKQLMVRADAAPNHVAMSYRDGDGFTGVSTAALWQTVQDIAAGLVALGVQRGDRVALHSSTRIEFTYFDYAIWAAGAATSTIYETSSADQVKWILQDSGAVALISEGDDTMAAYREIEHEVDTRHVFVIDDDAVGTISAMATDESRAELKARIDAITHDDLATLVYTSGTTGMPKGCMLTHGNFVWEVSQVDDQMRVLFTDDNRTLFFLPLAHIFARLAQAACVSSGVLIAYSSGIPNLLEELPMVKPTWVFSVPRVFEKIYNGAKAKADGDGKGAIFDRASAVAIAYSQGIDRGKTSLGTRLQHGLFDRLVYGKLRDVFGGDIKYAISGGAPLGARLGHYFRGIGITALEGYGLTETSAAATANKPDAIRVGTVGRPIQGSSVAIAEDGEVLIKGPHVFKGYWNNDVATKEAIDEDGWFHSGDVGALDDEGFLTITGRKKEILVTAAGKNVAPAVLEDRLRAHAIVSQVMVVGDAKPFIAALITLDEEVLPQWAEANDKADLSIDELRSDDDVLAAVQAAVDDANKAVSRAEAIKTFRVLPADLTIDGGELTPTLKVKRSVVASKYAGIIDEIYG